MLEELNFDDARRSSHDAGSTAGRDSLPEQLSEIARELQQQSSTEGTFKHLVDAAVLLVPGTEEASLTLLDGRTVRTSHASGEMSRRVDAAQQETGEGPCLDAVWEQQIVRVDDLRSTDRWPGFSPRAAAEGARSMLAIRLYVGETNIGALNLFSSRVAAFGDESEHVGLLLATHAAIAFQSSRDSDHLNQAIDSRDLIGQAKGILMERFSLTAQQAFLVLVRLSQNSNTKLHDLASTIVTTRELPEVSGTSAKD